MGRRTRASSESNPAREPTPCEAAPHGCAIVDLFRILGKAHMLDVLALLIHEDPGPKRFREFQDRLEISPNTLSERLKELAEAGLVTRTAYNEIPPRVDYEATAKAFDLRPVFESLADWAARHNLERETPQEAATA